MMRGAGKGKCQHYARIFQYLKRFIHSTHNFGTPVASNKHFYTKPSILKADSGASNHFLRPTHAHLLTKQKTLLNEPSAMLPD